MKPLVRSAFRQAFFAVAIVAIAGAAWPILAASSGSPQPPRSAPSSKPKPKAPPPATQPAAPPSSQPSSQPTSQPAREKLVIAGEEFELEIAATPESRELGLMNRDHIDDHGGMLFIHETPQMLGYWMKNCPIEMDILFVSNKGVIVAAHRMKPPPPRTKGETDQHYDDRLPRYESIKPAQFAIELQAGTIKRLKIRSGQTIEMDVERLVKMAASD